MDYFNTEYRTFLLGFTNTKKTIIFQDGVALKKALEIEKLQGNRIDVNTLKELNEFKRFAKVKNTPDWLITLMGRAIDEWSKDLRKEREEIKNGTIFDTI